MNDQPVASVRPVLRWMLFVLAALIGVDAGAGAFVTAVIFPLWSASPQAAIGWTPNTPYFVEEGRFFIIATPLTFMLCIATLIAGWRAVPPLRLWLRIATILFIALFVVTMAYFVPAQEMMKGAAGAQMPPAELGSMLQRFVVLNWLRQAVALFAFGAALHAFGISCRLTASKPSR